MERGRLYLSLTFAIVRSLDITHGDHAPWWDGDLCPCNDSHCIRQRSFPSDVGGLGGSCGRRAWASGGRQRVITYSLFGNLTKYWNGLEDILVTTKQHYPGWNVWLYTIPSGRENFFCPLMHAHPHLFLCDVTNLPPPLGDVTEVNPRMWRFLAMGDEMLSVMVVRDTDSKITERESRAVAEWLTYNTSFHLMRDHPFHVSPVLAGLWGARWDLRSKGGSLLSPGDMRNLRGAMVAKGRRPYHREQDQKVLWPVMTSSLTSHDSFKCKMYPAGTRPFPTRREHGLYVGNREYTNTTRRLLVKKHCPRACRPPQHQDWLFC
ncbi:uncharacterized protein LOC125026981 [Penaeus chinensis]|uniref:uncharacterized protein LOC125026981 n=1 Tax=Penaeus chinensis TaxID=139456 RepID=UPI001FB80AAA|nr:uncharacterized protein LOC125026981 [Penaeus chinensis]